jgi:midasin (ATPase involved in ribosome maturation)
LFIYFCHQYVLFLEPERKLLLAEKGSGEMGTEKSCIVTANTNFHFIGTMNPGGDYGKKEVCIFGFKYAFTDTDD